MTESQKVAAVETGGPRIFFIRGYKVMLDEDLAALYKIESQELRLVIARSIEQFPEDFVFQLTSDEFADLKSKSAISSREAPYVFTGQGLALLSSILFDEQGNYECAPTCSCRM